MALADAAERVGTPILPGPRCSIGYVIERLPEDERALLDTWLFEPPPPGELRKTAKWIAAVLAADGHTTTTGRAPSDQMVSHHRQKNCGCFR